MGVLIGEIQPKVFQQCLNPACSFFLCVTVCDHFGFDIFQDSSGFDVIKGFDHSAFEEDLQLHVLSHVFRWFDKL